MFRCGSEVILIFSPNIQFFGGTFFETIRFGAFYTSRSTLIRYQPSRRQSAYVLLSLCDSLENIGKL